MVSAVRRSRMGSPTIKVHEVNCMILESRGEISKVLSPLSDIATDWSRALIGRELYRTEIFS